MQEGRLLSEGLPQQVVTWLAAVAGPRAARALGAEGDSGRSMRLRGQNIGKTSPTFVTWPLTCFIHDLPMSLPEVCGRDPEGEEGRRRENERERGRERDREGKRGGERERRRRLKYEEQVVKHYDWYISKLSASVRWCPLWCDKPSHLPFYRPTTNIRRMSKCLFWKHLFYRALLWNCNRLAWACLWRKFTVITLIVPVLSTAAPSTTFLTCLHHSKKHCHVTYAWERSSERKREKEDKNGVTRMWNRCLKAKGRQFELTSCPEHSCTVTFLVTCTNCDTFSQGRMTQSPCIHRNDLCTNIHLFLMTRTWSTIFKWLFVLLCLVRHSVHIKVVLCSVYSMNCKVHLDTSCQRPFLTFVNSYESFKYTNNNMVLVCELVLWPLCSNFLHSSSGGTLRWGDIKTWGQKSCLTRHSSPYSFPFYQIKSLRPLALFCLVCFLSSFMHNMICISIVHMTSALAIRRTVSPATWQLVPPREEMAGQEEKLV